MLLELVGLPRMVLSCKFRPKLGAVARNVCGESGVSRRRTMISLGHTVASASCSFFFVQEAASRRPFEPMTHEDRKPYFSPLHTTNCLVGDFSG